MFEKWEEKDLPYTEANALLVSKQAVYLRPGASVDEQNRQSVVVKVKIKPPPKLPKQKTEKPPKEKMSDAEPPKEVKLGGKIKIRFTKEKKRDNIEGNVVRKRVTFEKASIPTKSVLIIRKTGLKQLPYAMHFVDHTKLDSYNELSFDENYAEPINPDTGEPEYSPELEKLIVAGVHSQMIEVATQFWKFILTRQHMIMMAMGGAAGIFIVIGLATVFHLFGGVHINWQPHAVG